MTKEFSKLQIQCPSFDCVLDRSTTLPNADRKVFRLDYYAHPVDAKIVKCLDLPGVRQVFGSAVSILTDLNMSQIISTGVPVGANTFPEIDNIVRDCSSKLGINKPYVVISNAISMNAITTGSDEEPFIILGNILVRTMNKEQLRFIIGHECGHIAMGHVIYHSVVNTLGSFTRAIPLIGPLAYRTTAFALSAWCRRSEITADRAGLLCCGDLAAAERSLVQTETGLINAAGVDISDYVNESKRYRRGNVLRRVNEYTAMHPPLTKRIEALRLFYNSQIFCDAMGMDKQSHLLNEKQLAEKTEALIAVLGKE